MAGRRKWSSAVCPLISDHWIRSSGIPLYVDPECSEACSVWTLWRIKVSDWTRGRDGSLSDSPCVFMWNIKSGIKHTQIKEKSIFSGRKYKSILFFFHLIMISWWRTFSNAHFPWTSVILYSIISLSCLPCFMSDFLILYPELWLMFTCNLVRLYCLTECTGCKSHNPTRAYQAN